MPGENLAGGNRRFRKHTPCDRNRAQDTHGQERPPCPLPLIFIEPIRDQQAKASAKRNPGSSDQHDLGDRKTSLCQSHIPLASHGAESTLLPLRCDLRNHVLRTGGVQPEDLNSVGAPHLHFQSPADRREFQMFLCRSDRCDDAQSDLAHMRTIPGRFDRPDRTRNHGRVPPVELRASQKTFGVAHAQILTLARMLRSHYDGRTPRRTVGN